MPEPLYALKTDLDMITNEVSELKRGYDTIDYIAHTVKKLWDEQICQAEQMRRIEDSLRGFQYVQVRQGEQIVELKADVAQLKTDVAQLKADVAQLKTDVAQLKADVAQLKTDVAQLKIDVAELKSNMAEIKSMLKKMSRRR